MNQPEDRPAADRSDSERDTLDELPPRTDDLQTIASEDKRFLARFDGNNPAAADLPAVPGYTLLRVLGRGGMGVVYLAEQHRPRRHVALKMVLGGQFASGQERGRLLAEANAVARLQHPNIVQVFAVGEHDGLPFLALELCTGGSLDRRLRDRPLTPIAAARLVETLARAVHAAHEANVLHRDLKPANVLLTDSEVPKITDFGLAKQLDEVGATQSGAIVGTVLFNYSGAPPGRPTDR